MSFFTDKEIEEMQKNPDILRALANQHDNTATELDAIETGIGLWYDKRRDELIREAERLEKFI